MENKNQIIIAGGGHAGVEAALAISRAGGHCTLVTMDASAIGRLSCNPAIGGLGKSHIVKEIDALGGIMGYAADASAIQFKTLNKTKGRAVWALRSQADKKVYPTIIQKIIKKNINIKVIEDEVVSYSTKQGRVVSVVLKSAGKVGCSCLIITSGTFLNGLIHVGENSYRAGRMGEKPSKGLTETLNDDGIKTGRLKTGTPPRISKNSIDWGLTKEMPGEKTEDPFSLFTKRPYKHINESCFLVDTNKNVHNVINNNLSLSPMFSGKIKAVGPRYCPSIEDKVFRFPKKNSHSLFIEPEWLGSNQMYLNGFSTSLPAKTQLCALKKIEAFKNIVILRPGYAIEYDYSPAYQLKESLESKVVGGLFLAGQINGTSGYEEAAAQGLVAGINAHLYAKKLSPFILERHESYIGVMINDLITSHLEEPYRMFTSRSENRLYLRADNVYSRLAKKALRSNLLLEKQQKTIDGLFSSVLLLEKFVQKTVSHNGKKEKLKTLLKRPEVSILPYLKPLNILENFNSLAAFFVETTIKYSGYIENEKDRFLKLQKSLSTPIPHDFNYGGVVGLSSESIERLSLVKPLSLYLASQVDGIRPTDLILLRASLNCVSRETK